MRSISSVSQFWNAFSTKAMKSSRFRMVCAANAGAWESGDARARLSASERVFAAITK